MNNLQGFAVGQRRHFDRPSLRRDYGVWEIVRIGANGEVYARCPEAVRAGDRDRDINMCYVNDATPTTLVEDEICEPEDWS